MLLLSNHQLNDICSHATSVAPEECCGMIGGRDSSAQSIYRLQNIAADPLRTYEADPEDLFAAQRRMRERGEEVVAIYHSHPRAVEPVPSETDVRLAYYPSAVYLIVGLAGSEPCLRAFRISEREKRWEAVDFEVIDG